MPVLKLAEEGMKKKEAIDFSLGKRPA